MRLSAWRQVGGLDPALHYVMDYDLWLRIGRRFGVVHVPRELARVRVHADTKTAGGGWKRLAEMEAVVRGHGGGGMPAYARFEAAALSCSDAARALRERDVCRAGSRVGGMLCTLASPVVAEAMARPSTWRAIARRLRRDRNST